MRLRASLYVHNCVTVSSLEIIALSSQLRAGSLGACSLAGIKRSKESWFCVSTHPLRIRQGSNRPIVAISAAALAVQSAGLEVRFRCRTCGWVQMRQVPPGLLLRMAERARLCSAPHRYCTPAPPYRRSHRRRLRLQSKGSRCWTRGPRHQMR